MQHLSSRIRHRGAFAVALACTTVISLTGGGVATASPESDALIEAIADSPYAGATGRSGSVLRLYTAVFLRLPDEAGFDYWVNTNTWDLREMARFFVTGDEFDATYGDLDDQAFVELIYQNVLGRAGEDAGVEYWIGVAGSAGRAEVVIGFSESVEYIGATTVPGSTDQSADASTLVGIQTAQWSDNVTISIGTDSFTFESNGLPSHELPDQFLVPVDGNMPPFDGDDIEADFEILNTADWIVESPISVEIPLVPVYSDEVTQTNLGQIGVVISGAQLFNDYEDMDLTFVAIDDNIDLNGVQFVDSCNGHPLQGGNDYHYHGIPYCITDAVDVDGAHSTIIGVLLDGFPVYGNKDDGGVTITDADLDECSGHFGPTPEFPDGIYHYHLTDDAAPYSIDCYHGVVDASADVTDGGGPGGGPPGGGRPSQ